MDKEIHYTMLLSNGPIKFKLNKTKNKVYTCGAVAVRDIPKRVLNASFRRMINEAKVIIKNQM